MPSAQPYGTVCLCAEQMDELAVENAAWSPSYYETQLTPRMQPGKEHTQACLALTQSDELIC